MELFDTKYVHCTWDESLKDKKVFYNNSITGLKKEVEGKAYDNDSRGICRAYDPDTLDRPFIIDDRGDAWSFVYYDPNYEVKRAYNEGKKIQFRYGSHDWIDYVFQDACWDDEGRKWRIKPEEPKRMTYRQLAEWLAKGNGQFRPSEASSWYYSLLGYLRNENDCEVLANYKIRRWGSDEWVEPTVDIYNEDCMS